LDHDAQKVGVAVTRRTRNRNVLRSILCCGSYSSCSVQTVHTCVPNAFLQNVKPR